jgi:MFS family permease
VFGATTAEYVGVYSFLVTLPLWLTSDFGMSDERAGWWAATFSTVTTLFIFLVGSVADTLGMRRTLVLSFGASALLRTIMALAPSSRVALPALLAFALAFAAGGPVLQAAVHRYATKNVRAFAFTAWYVALNLGGALSGFLVDATKAPFIDPATHMLVPRAIQLPFLGIATMTAYRAVMGLGTLSALVAFVLATTLRARSELEEKSAGNPAVTKRENPLAVLASVLKNKPFWRFLVLLGFLSLVRMMFQHMHFTWPKYVTRELGDDFPWGKVWALNAVLILFFAPLAAALTRNLPPLDVLLVGAFISAASPFVLCLGHSYGFQVATVVVLTVGEALWSPRSYEYTVAIAPRGRESTYVSLSSLPWFLAKFLVGPASGYLLTAFCPATGARHAALLWAAIGLTTMLGPIGILAFRGVIEGKRDPARAGATT